MDNDAFKELVRSKVKGNKEIARETVEDAFRQKQKKDKKRKRGANQRSGDLSSSSSSSESESKTNRQRHDRNDTISVDPDLKPASARRKQGTEKQQRYRDRAKERREGINGDYQSTENLASEQIAEGGQDMSKYLGGDEEHTHLVKGLDVALARSIRSRMQPERLVDPLAEAEIGSENRFQPLKTMEEARKLLQELDDSEMTTSSAQSMLQYLLKKWQGGARKPRVQIRSQLTFSVVGIPQDLATSWEVPSEQNLATGAIDNESIPKACPLSSDIIANIQKIQTKVSTSTLTVKRNSQPESQLSTALVNEGSDSDDDIFGNVEK